MEPVKMREVVRPGNFVGLAEKLAEDKLCQLNYYYPGGKEAFPVHPEMQFVGKYYPYANGGPLFIDELRNFEKTNKFHEKKAVMRKLGHRYLVISFGMTEMDAREQLAMCGGN
jgi:hypothetical protein